MHAPGPSQKTCCMYFLYESTQAPHIGYYLPLGPIRGWVLRQRTEARTPSRKRAGVSLPFPQPTSTARRLQLPVPVLDSRSTGQLLPLPFPSLLFALSLLLSPPVEASRSLLLLPPPFCLISQRIQSQLSSRPPFQSSTNAVPNLILPFCLSRPPRSSRPFLRVSLLHTAAPRRRALSPSFLPIVGAESSPCCGPRPL